MVGKSYRVCVVRVKAINRQKGFTGCWLDVAATREVIAGISGRQRPCHRPGLGSNRKLNAPQNSRIACNQSKLIDERGGTLDLSRNRNGCVIGLSCLGKVADKTKDSTKAK